MDNILSIENLRKEYSSFCLNLPKLELPKGMIIGFVGENGAGKTTTIKEIFSLINKDCGEVLYDGKKVEKLTTKEREKLALCFDEATLPYNFKLKDINRYGSLFFSSWDESLFDSLTAKLALPQDKTLKQFSKGMKAKAQLTFALSHHPDLLVLDEVTASLDPVVRDEVLQILQEFIEEGDKTVLLSSHLTSDLDKIADMIIFIHKGQILLTVTREQLDEEIAIVRAKGMIANEEHILSHITKKYSEEFLVDNKIEFQKINPDMVIDKATVEDILLFLTKQEDN